MAEAAWECADPGLQFDTTINRWHTVPNAGRITASNPCFTGDALVHTDKGLIRFDELFARANTGEEFRVWTHDATSPDAPARAVTLTSPEAFMITGKNPVQRLRFDNGMELRCTPSHRLFTKNRGYVEAADLTPDDRVMSLDLPAPATEADWSIPVASSWERDKGERDDPLYLPDVWTEDFAHYVGWLIGDGTTSGQTTATVYGSADDRTEILPWHQELVEQINGGRPLKVSEQANGTAQLRLSRKSFKRYLESLGVASVTGEHKRIPWSIEQAPPEVVAAFLRGLFDADGCVVNQVAKGTAYVGLGSISIELLRGSPANAVDVRDLVAHLQRAQGRREHVPVLGEGRYRTALPASGGLRPADHREERRAIRRIGRVHARLGSATSCRSWCSSVRRASTTSTRRCGSSTVPTKASSSRTTCPSLGTTHTW